MKKTAGCLISLIVIIFIIIGLVWVFVIEIHPVKTEYGDFFTIRGGGLTEGYSVLDENSDFSCEIKEYNGRKDFKHICETTYFRCYQIKNDKENVYIFKIKDVGSFDEIYSLEDIICSDEEKKYMVEYVEHVYSGQRGEVILTHLLCNEHLIEIAAPIIFEVYPGKMGEIAKNLNNGDYAKLKEYGLTDEMVKDTESLEKKKVIVNQLVEERRRKY